jgi:hypothetical protein
MCAVVVMTADATESTEKSMSALGIELPRVRVERERKGVLVRVFWRRWSEVAYLSLRLCGLCATIEFPSDWHEERKGWIRLGLGLFTVAVAFPWKWTVPDEGQCSGPRYGFCFYEDLLWIYYGKDKGKRDDPRITVRMPWGWRHKLHEMLSEPETHSYRYTLRSGEVQERTATITVERRVWVRPWFPWRRESRSIGIDFNAEVGERTGSWKGGVLGCGWDMLPGETPLDTLRRMERERRFT